MSTACLRKAIEDREWDKFACTDDDLTAVRVLLENTAAFTPSGLTTGGLITIVTINDSTWTALPPTALTARNAICLQNQSSTAIKINYDNTVVGYVGIEVGAGGQRYYDITDSIPIYAKSSSGNVDLAIEEIA